MRPIPNGLTGGNRDSRIVVQPEPMFFGSATSLEAVSREHFIFTPALPCIYGGMTPVILGEFVRLHPFAKFQATLFGSPIFDGLDRGHDRSWNFSLWFLPRRYEKSFVNFMISTTVRNENGAFRYGYQEIVVRDPLTTDVRPDLPDDIRIGYFGLRTDIGDVFLQKPSEGARPAPRRSAVPDPTIAAQDARFEAGENPVDIVDQQDDARTNTGSVRTDEPCHFRDGSAAVTAIGVAPDELRRLLD